LYFGWHYILDDIAGMGIGWASVTVAGWATGHRRRRNLQPAEPVIASDTEAAVTSEEDTTAEVPQVSEANVSALEAEKRTLLVATQLGPDAERSPPQPPVRRTAYGSARRLRPNATVSRCRGAAPPSSSLPRAGRIEHRRPERQSTAAPGRRRIPVRPVRR